MRTCLLALLLIAASFVDAAKKKDKKKDLDELESLLENIDEDQETETAAPTKKAAVVVKNPCEDHVCGWGKECVVGKKGEPHCECISKCPELDGDPMDKVCANNNETFVSLCDLYRERCLCKKGSKQCAKKSHAKVHLEYLGECKLLSECTDDLMAQFPERMADWLFQVMKELKKRRELHKLEWEELIQEAEADDEKRHVYPVIWKFCDLDIKPHDKAVSHHELIPITAPVIPMESCIKPFLEGCDTDNDGTISIHEWGKCLGLKDGKDCWKIPE
ncbi:Kazal-type serine protease inhibitor domain protein [Ancylostoma caninum]|uniref:Kazal-type serine protease inhibitor domain protein n=3 Tax=Ancylostoma TaxID=29169 RepID=A0A368FLZ8_ANCCA|nr:Kazal-type serine protease inhibitor domain protein [Ancylostoma caninum]